MNIYLTFADQPSGVYQSQVEDLVNYLNTIENSETKLIAFISLRNFLINRNKLKLSVRKAIVLPMWPKLQNWLLNRFILYFIFLFVKPKIVIARGVFAGCLALRCKSKKLVNSVIYDGRGALSAEWKEYSVVTNDWLKDNIERWEKEIVLKSDKQIAISTKLIEYWKKKFEYIDLNSTVIPCTLSSVYESIKPDVNSNHNLRTQLGLPQEDVVLVYSGSIAGWQSSELLSEFLIKQFSLQTNITVLFLSRETIEITKLKRMFPGKIASTFLHPSKVPDYLMACDYGLLIRENTVTNEVASPVKFAEYLACGLKVIISPKIGDYSRLAIENAVGILSNQLQTVLEPVNIQEKERCRDFALMHFAKNQYVNMYKSILNISELP